MSKAVNRQWLLKQRPVGVPDRHCYEWRETPVPEAGDGEIVIRNTYLSLDPAIRGWMSDAPSYMPPIPLGSVVRATAVGCVVESRSRGFAVGDMVLGLNGWEDYSVSGSGGFTAKVPAGLGLPATNFLSVLGAVGMTAYFGLLDVGQPKAGETVLVSGAAGAVGSLAGQIARIKGCRAVGIAGGAAKCAWIKDECGFDAVIDYKSVAPQHMAAAIRAACPNGVDIYFDNVGGPMLDAVLLTINERARLLMCGAISGYNATEPQPGPSNLWQLLVKSARLEGLLVRTYLDRFPEGIAIMAEWVRSGRIKFREHIDRGLEHTPESFNRLFTGDHQGKLIVDIASESFQ